jgi:hypothetical protein
LIPGEGGSCSSETKPDRKKVPRAKLFFSHRRLKEQSRNPKKLSWVRLRATAEWHHNQKTKVACFRVEIAGTKATTLKNLP